MAPIMIQQQRASIFAGLAAAMLLLQGGAATYTCSAPSNGACAYPEYCHYENYYDSKSGSTIEKCLSCPSGSSIAWTGRKSSPTPKCIYSTVDPAAACDPSFIAYKHYGGRTSAACYDQCVTTDNIYYGADGNPSGCKDSRRRLTGTYCQSPVAGACAYPARCHYENYYDAAAGKSVEKCLSCPSGSSIAWTGKNSSPVPKCIYSNLDAAAACDPSFIAYTHIGDNTTAACYDRCLTTDNIYYDSNGNPTGCKQ